MRRGGECATSPHNFGTVRRMQGVELLVELHDTHAFHASALTTERTENHFGEARQEDRNMTIRHYISFETKIGLVKAIYDSGGAQPPSQQLSVRPPSADQPASGIAAVLRRRARSDSVKKRKNMPPSVAQPYVHIANVRRLTSPCVHFALGPMRQVRFRQAQDQACCRCFCC